MRDALSSPAEFIRVEAAALAELAVRLDGDLRETLEALIERMARCCEAGGTIVLTGVGKSGLIARKVAGTLNSTGTRAYFLHAGEALHGDLGLLRAGDCVLALSYSGETEELVRLLPSFARLGVTLLAFTAQPGSTIARAAAAALDCGVREEACRLNLAPTASTTAMLALGDAVALALSERAGFAPEHFADLHPGGRLGLRLARVRDLMHAGEALPRVTPGTAMSAVIHEMSRRKLGMTTVLTLDSSGRERLAGIIVDGDLRRLLEQVGPEALKRTAGEIMHATPQTIAPDAFAADALARMEARKITSLVVVEDQVVAGVVHLHDLLEWARR